MRARCEPNEESARATCLRRRSSSGASAFACAVAALVFLVLAPYVVQAQQSQLQTDVSEVYAGQPFVVSVVSRGFTESPTPEAETPSIPGAEVVALDPRPNVSTRVTIVNGRRSESRDVTWVHGFRVEPQSTGTYTIPSITISQGGVSSSTDPVEFTAKQIGRTDDLAIEMVLPEREVRVGETFDVYVDWFLRKNVKQQTFDVPLFDATEFVDIEPAESKSRRRIGIDTDGGKIELPFQQSEVRRDGKRYTRVRLMARATPKRPGKLELEPVSVNAHLEVGKTRGRFGMARSRTRLFRAEGRPRTLVIEKLPEGAPESFSNAVGRDFSLDVDADRTVVKVGDPVTLTLEVRGRGNLEGLILPSLDKMGLDPDLFSLPASPPVGESIDDGSAQSGRRYEVSVRVRSERVSEIPPLAFSWYAPQRNDYQTTRSDPIALHVAGADLVSASDVVSSKDRGGGAADDAAPDSGAASTTVSLVGADLGLSDPSTALDAPWTLDDVLPLVIALYGLPLIALGVFAWRRRRAAGAELRASHRALVDDLDAALDEASSDPAIDVAPRINAAINKLRRAARPGETLETDVDALIEELDVVAFAPDAAQRPLDQELVDDARALGERLAAALEANRVSDAERGGGAVAALIVLSALSLGLIAIPRAASAAELEAARAAYQEAMAEDARSARTASFARAEALFAELVDAHPRSPALLVDWGNAALGAQDVGKAVLAYRRALRVDPDNERARRNLTWVRDTMPEWLPQPSSEGRASSVLFWPRMLGRPWVALASGLAFALAILLVAPWGGSRGWRNARILLAFVPALLWLWLGASLLVGSTGEDAAVVMVDGATLRSADNSGALPAVSKPLPAGAEVELEEVRDDWARVRLADGREGWIRRSAVAPVALADDS